MKVTSNGRVRRTESEWLEILSRYEASELPARAFCAREGLSVKSLRRWQRRLGRRTGSFVELVPAAESRISSWEVEVRLPNGTGLTFRG